MSARDFYVGYEARAPVQLGRFLRKVSGLLVLGGLVIAALLGGLQRPFDPGSFEYGVVRDFEGLLLEYPVPTLIVDRPGLSVPGQPSTSRFLLVAPGKFGAGDLVAGMDDQRARVQGSLIFRGAETMIELVPDSIVQIASSSQPDPGASINLGLHTLMGEIVDSKCYLGVMKPGREKTHRACAARCISGGVPPILRVDVVGREPVHLLLVDHDGGPLNKQVLEFVAEPVEVSGRVLRLGTQLVLYTDSVSIKRRAR